LAKDLNDPPLDFGGRPNVEGDHQDSVRVDDFREASVPMSERGGFSRPSTGSDDDAGMTGLDNR